MVQQRSTVPLLDEQPQPPNALATTDDGSLIERLSRDPNVDVDKFERFLQMRERERARLAKEAFNAAMSACQAELEPVRADAYNPQTRSRYPSYEALDRACRPIYTKHGFALSFDTAESAIAEHVLILCYCSHRDGHDHTYRVDMPADGKGAKGGDVMTKTHATGSAMSYGQRYLLKFIFNLAVAEDDDGNKAGRQEEERPDPPEGFAKWIESLKQAASKGLKAFEPAWECSEGTMKNFAHKWHRDDVNALKKLAADVSKGQGR